MALIGSLLLTWLGVQRSSPKALLVATAISTIVAVPLAWSIGPFVLLLAAFQAGLALALRQLLRWWAAVAVVSAAAGIWVATIIIGAMLFGS